MTPRPRSFWIGLLLLWPALAYLNQWLVTPRGGIPLWAAAGAGAAILAWYASTRWQIRCRASLISLALFWLLGSGLLALLDGSSLLAGALGSDSWVLLRQASAAALAAFCLVGALRTLSWRFPALAVVELAAAGGVFILALEAHRDGFINRPFQLVDPLWLKGMDPTPLFLAVGSLALLATSLLALNRPNNQRPWWDVPLLLLVLMGLFLAAPSGRVKQLFEKFGMGKEPGKENRLGPEGGLKTPGPASPANGDPSKSQQKQDEPSFADSPPPKPRPVAVVVFRDDYQPPSGSYYFRQTSNSQFNGLKLVHSNDDRFDRDSAQGFPTRYHDEKARAEPLGLQAPDLDTSLFQPLSTRVALLIQHPRPFGLIHPEHYWATPNPDPERFQKAYEVDSLVFKGTYPELIPASPGQSSWDAETWAHYLEGPADRRYDELVDKILAELPEQRRNMAFFKAVAIKMWLDENCTYSLKSPSADASDPVSHFLFGQRIGYCVFTSHSACYLYRAAGIPARISSGYMVNAQQRGGGSSLLIRSSDAHSWPEIYLDGAGWLDLDIAPKKNLEPEHEQVDNNLQQMMGDMARKDKKDRRPEETRPQIDLQEMLQRLLLEVARTIPWALIAVWLTLTLWKVWRRLSPWFWSGRGLARVAYLAALDVLAEQGVTRHIDESCEAFARRLQEEVPALLPLAQAHLRVRLGNQPPPAEAELRQTLKLCLAQLRKRSQKGWRRALGWLDPTSGLRVR
ncbi:transglutaminase domain-containing protein [bacterium]|nr:transglutaminase domain-containing protein [bacterium]